jgi:hypothetical protein
MAKAKPNNTRNVAAIQTSVEAIEDGAGPDSFPCKRAPMDGVCSFCGAGPDDVCDHFVRRVRHWRAKRIMRFADRQAHERRWIEFGELAERYGRNVGISEGYELLRRAVIAGEFERAGRCRVLYLHPFDIHTKMTRERMANISESYIDAVPSSHASYFRRTLERQYLACCWIPRDMAAAWCSTHNIGRDIARRIAPQAIDDSEALDEARKPVSQGYSDRSAADHVASTRPVASNSRAAYADRLRHKLAAERKG